jgi:hypothetical protein
MGKRRTVHTNLAGNNHFWCLDGMNTLKLIYVENPRYVGFDWTQPL